MDLAQRFTKLYSGVVYDAMCFDIGYFAPFAVDMNIKPAWSLDNQVVFGPAFTCRGQPVQHEKDIDDSVRIEMFKAFTQGCVQVIDTANDASVAHFGDISGKIARKFGCVGAVVDGFTRDVRWLQRDGFPIFCRGVQPIDAFGKWQIVDYQVPITLNGINGRINVFPGDYIFGDPDGVLVIPKNIATEVCRYAETRLEREEMVRHRLAETDNIQGLYNEIGRW